MSRFCHVQMWDEWFRFRQIRVICTFKQLILHFDRRSGMGSFFMELMRDDRDGGMIPGRQKNLERRHRQ